MLSSAAFLVAAIIGSTDAQQVARYRSAMTQVGAPGRLSPLRERAVPAACVETPPVPLLRVEPDLPRAHRSSRLVIECVVDEAGVARECEVLSSWPEAEPIALAALSEWRFEPARSEGVPHAVTVRWTWQSAATQPRRRDWKPGWRFTWNRPALTYEW